MIRSYNREAGKLTKIDYPSGSTSSEYKYNGDGVRVKKVASDGTETYFIYDGANVIMEVDTDGDAQATYTYGANGLISQKLGATSYYVGCDHLGSVWDVVTLDTNENVDVSYVHTAFGNTTRTLRQGAADPNDAYRYVGALGYYADADDESGLLLLGARYYRPSIGRFITLDPIRDSLNWYVYVGGNPTNGVDPHGHSKIKCSLETKCEFKYDVFTGKYTFECRVTLVCKSVDEDKPKPPSPPPDDKPCPPDTVVIYCADGTKLCIPNDIYEPGKDYCPQKPEPDPCSKQ